MRLFVISRIIKGEVSVISQSRRLRLITVTYISIFYKYFSFSHDKLSSSSHCLSFTECELCDRADHMTNHIAAVRPR